MAAVVDHRELEHVVLDVPAPCYEEEISDEMDDVDIEEIDVDEKGLTAEGYGSSACLDDSLTNLQWLRELQPPSNREPGPPTPPSDGQVTQNNRPKKRKKQRPKPVIDPADLPENPTAEDYRTNKNLKPPHSYAQLIYDAIKTENKPLITLSAIYDYFRTNFRYYCYADCSWQNSVRHNLSLNKCFQKVPRAKGDKGKGGFWMLAPGHEELFEQASRKKGYKSARKRSASGNDEELPGKRRHRRRSDSESSQRPSQQRHDEVRESTPSPDNGEEAGGETEGCNYNPSSKLSSSDCFQPTEQFSERRTSSPIRHTCALPAELNSSICNFQLNLPESPESGVSECNNHSAPGVSVLDLLWNEEQMSTCLNNDDPSDEDAIRLLAEGLLTNDILFQGHDTLPGPPLTSHNLPVGMVTSHPSVLAPQYPPVTVACRSAHAANFAS